jgi:hypothetical protein
MAKQEITNDLHFEPYPEYGKTFPRPGRRTPAQGVSFETHRRAILGMRSGEKFPL